MNTNKNVLIVVAVIALIGVAAGLGYLLMKNSTPVPVAETATTTDMNVSEQPAVTTPVRTYAWAFTPAGTGSASEDRTKVTLTTGGKTYDAGTYSGSCVVIADAELKDANELTGVLCYFAGAGDEVGVFEENGKIVIRAGEVMEPTGEGGPFRGNFKTLVEVQ